MKAFNLLSTIFLSLFIINTSQAQVSYDGNKVCKVYGDMNVDQLTLTLPSNTDDVVLVILLGTATDESPTVRYEGVNIGAAKISQYQESGGGGSFDDAEGSIYVYELGNITTSSNVAITVEDLSSTDEINAFCAMTFSGVNQTTPVGQTQVADHPNPHSSPPPTSTAVPSTSLTFSSIMPGDALISSFHPSANTSSDATVAGDLVDLSVGSGEYDEAGYKIATAASHTSTYTIAGIQTVAFIHPALVLNQAGGGAAPTVNVTAVTTSSTTIENSGTPFKYTFTISTTNPSTSTIVKFEVSGGTASSGDFTVQTGGTFNVSFGTPLANQGTIEIPMNQTTAKLEIIPNSDAIIEDDETVVVKILAP